MADVINNIKIVEHLTMTGYVYVYGFVYFV